ncbi:hypothetical protein AWENTII_004074 [Aspergillus wentii]
MLILPICILFTGIFIELLKDFFYVCPAHLKDRNFCSPVVDTEEQQAKKKQDAMALEIEKVKKEYEEKQKKKKEKEQEKEKEKKATDDNAKEKDDQSKTDKNKDGSDKSDEKERDDKIDSIRKSDTTGVSTPTSDDSPRIFSLHKNFYQMRIDRLRNMEMAKRNRQRLQDPSLFPSVPSGGI